MSLNFATNFWFFACCLPLLPYSFPHFWCLFAFELGNVLPVTRPRGFQILFVLSFYCFAVVFIYWRKRRGGFYIYASCFYFIPSHEISSIPITRPIGCLLGPLFIILCFYSRAPFVLAHYRRDLFIWTSRRSFRALSDYFCWRSESILRPSHVSMVVVAAHFNSAPPVFGR